MTSLFFYASNFVFSQTTIVKTRRISCFPQNHRYFLNFMQSAPMIPEIRLQMLYSQFIFQNLFQVNQQIINVLQVSPVTAGSQYVIATLSDIILIVNYELCK